MKTNDFDYYLPEELIAQEPLLDRSSCKFLVYNKETKEIKDDRFYNIASYFVSGDVLVLNDTKVMKARLYGKKQDTGASVELLILRPLSNNLFLAIAKPKKRVKVGSVIVFSDKFSCIVRSVTDDLCIEVEFPSGIDVLASLDEIGHIPLPPYIKKELSDSDMYQTVYAKNLGSAAAPTAGFHFTPSLLKELKDKGVIVTYLTLSIGLGTFLPVKTEVIEEHKMHGEDYYISEELEGILNLARKEKRRIIACGTTVLRALESNYKDGLNTKGHYNTSIFLYPPYKVKSIDAIITNFHLPKSTLLMLISTIIPLNELMRIYEHAISEKYRFFSFGDAMLITGGYNGHTN